MINLKLFCCLVIIQFFNKINQVQMNTYYFIKSNFLQSSQKYTRKRDQINKNNGKIQDFSKNNNITAGFTNFNGQRVISYKQKGQTKSRQKIIKLQKPKDITLEFAQQKCLKQLPELQKLDSLSRMQIILKIFLCLLELSKIHGFLNPSPKNIIISPDKEIVISQINYRQQSLATLKQKLTMDEFIKIFISLYDNYLPKSIKKLHFESLDHFIASFNAIIKKQNIHKKCHQLIKNNKFNNNGFSNRNKQNIQKLQIGQFRRNNNQSQSNKFQLVKPDKKLEFIRTNKIKKFPSSIQLCKDKQKSYNGSIILNKRATISYQCSDEILNEIQAFMDQPRYYPTPKYEPSMFKKFNKRNDFKSLSPELKKLSRKQVNAQLDNLLVNQVRSQQKLFISSQKLSFQKNKSPQNSKHKIHQPYSAIKGLMNDKQAQNTEINKVQSDYKLNEQSHEKLKNSFPFKSASTLNSFGSYQKQNYVSKRQEIQGDSTPIFKQPSWIKDMIQEQLQIINVERQILNIQHDFNTIFTSNNSFVANDSMHRQEIKQLINQFQSILQF